jgi:cystathionine beta-lyase
MPSTFDFDQIILEHAQEALSAGENFGPGGAGFVRLNFACPRMVLEEELHRMKKALG